jgi:hypothetical protein
MRIRGIYLLVLVLLALPGRTAAQQDGASSGKKGETQVDINSAPRPEKENWGVLDDLKTGLVSTAVAELQRDEEPGFVRQLLRVEWRLTDPIDVWVIRPKVAGKVPVILYLYGYPDAGEHFRDNGWCKRATADGFAAVGFVSALTDYRFRFRPLRQWFVSELAESVGTTVHDVQLLVNLLADRGDMEMDHVGLFGMGSGATIAILAAHADPRIKSLDLLDPWGDWPDWLKESPVVSDDERSKYLSPEFLKSVAGLDPVAYLPSLKTPGLRLQQTLSEPESPTVAKERIAASLPNPSQLVKYKNAQDLLKAWETSGLSGWLKQQMRLQSPNGGSGESAAANSRTDLTPGGFVSQGLTTQNGK